MTELQKRFTELAKRSEKVCFAIYTNFLGMAEISELNVLNLLVKYSLWGGYEGAERVVACFGECGENQMHCSYPISCVKISPRSQKFAGRISHRDFLGALIGLGLCREVLGDIIVRENEGYVFCIDNISAYITENLTQVGRTAVECEMIEDFAGQNFSGIFVRLETCELIVASERLDAVISAAYFVSRSEALKMVNSEKVFINGRNILNASQKLSDGDIVSVRGYGRFIYDGVIHHTKKDRLVITVKKYV